MTKSIGWFDAFRADGAPTWYGDNRTNVVTDTTTLGIVLVFAVFLVSFLIVLPGIRRERLSSFVSIVMTLSTGSVLLVTIHHPGWHVGNVKIYAPYRAFTTDKLDAFLGVRVGLRHVNITLRSSDVRHTDFNPHLDYNERFQLNAIRSMEQELTKSLHKGMPYPILSVIEYMSVDRAGFIWGRQYRLAGYYTSIMLWFCVGLWLVQVVLLCFCPVYYSRSLLIIGSCLWTTDAIYVLCCPRRMAIRFPDVDTDMPVLDFRLGWCFWAVLITGAVSLLYGCVLRVLELKHVYHFVTFLEPDFDCGRRDIKKTMLHPTDTYRVSVARPRRRGVDTVVRPPLDNTLVVPAATVDSQQQQVVHGSPKPSPFVITDSPDYPKAAVFEPTGFVMLEPACDPALERKSSVPCLVVTSPKDPQKWN